MAKATVGAAGIEFIQGALLKPKKANGHKHGNYLIMTHRTAPTTNPNCQRIYSKPADAYQRSTAPSADELTVRARFSAIARMVNTRSKDVTKIAGDKASFEEQKNYPGGKKTMRSWYWMVCSNEYDQQQG